MDIKREDYLRIVNNYYIKNEISGDLIFLWYKEKGGTLKRPDEFFNFINMANALHFCVQRIFLEFNMQFEVSILTKDSKFITAL